MDASSDFFEVDGIVLNGGVAIASGSINPSIDTLDLPKGSAYLRDNGEIWSKVGFANTDWILTNSQQITLESLEEMVMFNLIGDPELVFMDDKVVKVKI